MTKQTNNCTGSSWRLKMFLRLACNRVLRMSSARAPSLKQLMFICVFLQRLKACERSHDWLDERSPSRAGSPVAKNFFQATSLGIYTVKTRIDSCFIVENIWLLTFCHGFWWIRTSYSRPIHCPCSILVYWSRCAMAFCACAKIPKMALDEYDQ